MGRLKVFGVVDPDEAIVVGRSSQSAKRIKSDRSIDASSKEKLFAFFGRKVARHFDGDVDPSGAIGQAAFKHACKAVLQGDFGDSDRTVRSSGVSTGVKNVFIGGVVEGAKHPHHPVRGIVLGFVIVGNVVVSGYGVGRRLDVGVVYWSNGSIICWRIDGAYLN